MNRLSWSNWIAVILILLTAGWMLFDGARALTLGDYVTPSSGASTGQLGPWSNIAKAVGIEPRSTLMKSIIAGYGLIALGLAVCFIVGWPWTRVALIVIAILGLWYLPIGTIANLIALIILIFSKGN